GCRRVPARAGDRADAADRAWRGAAAPCGGRTAGRLPRLPADARHRDVARRVCCAQLWRRGDDIARRAFRSRPGVAPCRR
ncbi:MAG: hypothetical protein KJZ64_07440, partial [Sphingomonadaceae bacterium]|nr:hypothetical protein [Sphingomonadaceae bacterium]